jgi:hypothetical protein
MFECISFRTTCIMQPAELRATLCCFIFAVMTIVGNRLKEYTGPNKVAAYSC